VADDRVEIRWFPPSWFQIKGVGKVIYIDPAYIKKYFTDFPTKIDCSHWPEQVDGLPDDLEPADLILVTHAHKDHVKRVTVERLKKPGTRVVAPGTCKTELGTEFEVVLPGDVIQPGGISTRVVNAYNVPKPGSKKTWHRKGSGVGYLVTIDGKTIYHAGDSDFIDDMRSLGRVDVALIPIGGTFTMDAEEAVEAVMSIAPMVVIPMHVMGADPDAFKRAVEMCSDIEVLVLETGGSYRVR